MFDVFVKGLAYLPFILLLLKQINGIPIIQTKHLHGSDIKLRLSEQRFCVKKIEKWKIFILIHLWGTGQLNNISLGLCSQYLLLFVESKWCYQM